MAVALLNSMLVQDAKEMIKQWSDIRCTMDVVAWSMSVQRISLYCLLILQIRWRTNYDTVESAQEISYS
ncbi:hypothetical protein KIN20_006275 [Parelaphostrongylus tenuis]|uniref:Uncharacterized protein n=1 Tax=Parelaphostrongylus tenuis TaxID=148309 RepID=A0AAD5MMS0_PARTN|nr:hypothetical protein KIN20_006275 [Parelaphostrongylus tenuis]